MELGKLGTTTDANGDSVYSQFSNPLLQQGVIGYAANAMGQQMDPRNFAKSPVAAAIANLVGGKVVTDPLSAGLNATSRQLAIQITGGDPVNAGAICMVMGNDCDRFASVRAKSWEICSLLGIPFDAQMAEKIWTAIFGA